jgi:hypothetical protein
MRGLERVVGASFQFEKPRGGALWFADGVPIRGTAPLFGPFEVLATVLLQTSTRLTAILKYPMPHADEPGQYFTPRILWQPGDDQRADGRAGSGAPDSER